MQVLFCILISAFFAVLRSTNGQYSKKEQGMSVSLFQFDPKELGIYHEPKHNKKIIKKNSIAKKNKVSKKDALPSALASNTSTSAAKLLANPTPSKTDAEEHLKNVKFDGTHNSTTTSLLNNSSSAIASVGTNATNISAAKLPTEKLMFYKNKTKSESDGSEQVNSVKLTKTTPPEEAPAGIVKNITIVTPRKNNSTFMNATHGNDTASNTDKTTNATASVTGSFSNASAVDLMSSSITKNGTVGGDDSKLNTDKTAFPASNASISSPANDAANIMIANNTTISKNSTTTNRNMTGAGRRGEILSHFIPTIQSSAAVGHIDSFQAGSRKHKIHHMYPECYQCPKHSNYTECVKKATLLQCNKGLDNICFAKSHKQGNVADTKDSITYEMGCTNHTHCKNAKAFPCRDGSKHCFTCCQFNKCNASPHHGSFETDEINLDELTKDKQDDEKKKSDASLKHVSPTLSVTMAVASWFLVYVLM